MLRAPETPLILWICAAVCAHFLFAEGGDQVAKDHEDRSYIFQLGTRARSAAHGKDQTFDLITTSDGQPSEKEPEPPKPEAKKEDKKPEPPEPKKEQKKPEEPPKVDVKVV